MMFSLRRMTSIFHGECFFLLEFFPYRGIVPWVGFFFMGLFHAMGERLLSSWVVLTFGGFVGVDGVYLLAFGFFSRGWLWGSM